MEGRKGISDMEELLLAVRFLIYFMVSVIACKSKFHAIAALDVAFEATDGYLKKELKEIFHFL